MSKNPITAKVENGMSAVIKQEWPLLWLGMKTASRVDTLDLAAEGALGILTGQSSNRVLLKPPASQASWQQAHCIPCTWR